MDRFGKLPSWAQLLIVLLVATGLAVGLYFVLGQLGPLANFD